MRSDASIFRFAPSPNGYLHLGHAFSAILNSNAASRNGGRFLLRIEDIDLGRARAEFETAICDDLNWLGLAWEPEVLRQSDRFDGYRKAIAELDRLGLLYPAFLTRKEIRTAIAEKKAKSEQWPCDPDNVPHYPGPERHWPESRRRAARTGGQPHALRIDMAQVMTQLPDLAWEEANPFDRADRRTIEAEPAAWGDVVIARSDVPASYHLSVVVDDAFQATSHVIRGVDLAPSTSVHLMLQNLLGLPTPDYFHHRLIADETGRKLSKSAGSESLHDLRRQGRSADEIRLALLPFLTEPAPPAGAAGTEATPPL